MMSFSLLYILFQDQDFLSEHCRAPDDRTPAVNSIEKYKDSLR